MNKAVGILAFVAGAAIGSVVTWKLVKTKYEQIANDEIASVIEEFRKDNPKPVKKVETKEQKDEEPSEKTEVEEHKELVNELHYTSQSEDVKKRHIKNKDIYVIDPEIVGDCDYKVVSLTFYADNVLTYEDGGLIRDVDELIGSDSLNHFGEFEEDAVHVRNNIRKIDFEILADSRKYSELYSTASRPASNG